MARRGSTVAEHLPLHQKVEGSNPASPGTEGENGKEIQGLNDMASMENLR
jgi:hypothetical protein